MREITTLLSINDPGEVAQLLKKFKAVLADRFQQSASGYSYYTDEEKLLMQRRSELFEELCQQSAWQAKRKKIIFTLCHLFTRPFKRGESSYQK
jgi:hypothetical protein